MDALENYRKKIDKIDSEITRLFEDRMNVVLDVAKYKEENNLPIFHKGREEAVIKKNIDRLNNKDYKTEIEKFYNSLMEVSRELQGRKLNRNIDKLNESDLEKFKDDITGCQSNKVSIVFSVDDKPGELYNILKYFSENNINICRIESCSNKNEINKSLIYLDLEVGVDSFEILKVINLLKVNSKYFKVLG